MDESQIPPRGPHHSPQSPRNDPQNSSYRSCILDSDPVFWMYDPQTISGYSPKIAYGPSSPLYKHQPSPRQSPQHSSEITLHEPSSRPYGPQSLPHQSSQYSPQISPHSFRNKEHRAPREAIPTVMNSIEDEADDVYHPASTAGEVPLGSEAARQESKESDYEDVGGRERDVSSGLFVGSETGFDIESSYVSESDEEMEGALEAENLGVWGPLQQDRARSGQGQQELGHQVLEQRLGQVPDLGRIPGLGQLPISRQQAFQHQFQQQIQGHRQKLGQVPAYGQTIAQIPAQEQQELGQQLQGYRRQLGRMPTYGQHLGQLPALAQQQSGRPIQGPWFGRQNPTAAAAAAIPVGSYLVRFKQNGGRPVAEAWRRSVNGRWDPVASLEGGTGEIMLFP